jgi:formate/nitrite transporter FocA (FNT family)
LIRNLAPTELLARRGAVGDGFARTFAAVTVGNVIGGGVLAGAVYWFITLRRR